MTAKSKEDSSTEPQGEEQFLSVHDELRELKASKIVNRNVLWSVGAGFIPVPMVDTGVLSLVQLKMLAELSKYYGVSFSRNMGKSVISILVGFVTANSLRSSFLTGLIKAIPYVGLAGAISMPIYGGAVTYAIGKLFVQHFESGGTFLSFKPYKVKKYFLKLYEEGQAAVSKMKNENPAGQTS